MKCRECNCCKKGWFDYMPDVYVCTGVKEPFAINDINHECTEYEDRKDKIDIESAIAHFKYGITHDIFSEPVTSYAKMAVDALEEWLHNRCIVRCKDCKFLKTGRTTFGAYVYCGHDEGLRDIFNPDACFCCHGQENN